jgi:ABC-type multidrug transport system ATPase subunit
VKLIIDNVSKQYSRDLWGLRNVRLELGPGILGLLGPNGAGKSTLMRILATITRATSGTITWSGVDIARSPNALRSVLGYLPQDFGVYPHLNALEFLEYLAAIKGLNARQSRQRIDALLEVVNLAGVRKRPLGSFSGGMKQRLGIAQALLNDPKLLIVDEPTAGLDPEERVRFRNLLTDISDERIVILSTHIVSDVEAIAGEIALLNRGRLLAHTTLEHLLQTVQGKVWEIVTSDEHLITLKQTSVVSSAIRRSDGILARIIAPNAPLAQASAVAPNLEDAYLYAITANRADVSASSAIVEIER